VKKSRADRLWPGFLQTVRFHPELTYISMYSANGGHRGDVGDCTAMGTRALPALLNTSAGNLVLAGIHCIITCAIVLGQVFN
jgi:hypothetical protein